MLGITFIRRLTGEIEDLEAELKDLRAMRDSRGRGQ